MCVGGGVSGLGEGQELRTRLATNLDDIPDPTA